MKLREIRELLKSGKPIQNKTRCGGWITWMEEDVMQFNCEADCYRIAPEPKLRPWKPEEAVGKVVRLKNDHRYVSIITGVESNIFISSINVTRDAQWYLENCECLDGSPCGVMEW